MAQTVFLSQPVNITVPMVLDLTTATGALNTVNFNTTALLDNGITLTNATTFTYSSNQAWYVTIKAASANFSGSSSTPMPASVIQYRLNGSGGSFTALTATAASLTGTTGTKNSRGTSTIGVDFFLNPGYIYAPATDYTITINYTISNL
ncbi:hypothetical protein [Mucilaginibacter sp.]